MINLRAGHARPLRGGGGLGWWYRQGARAACMPPLRIIRLVGDMGDYVFNIGCRALWKGLAICSLL